ncbi:MAG TPA: RNA polymerase sigma factor [Solirubrobacterales bacterium]|nr:RNA polymerase sigma factor [Solirubrobacterales bacterium]
MLVQGEGRRLDPETAGDHIDTLFRAACAMSGSRDLAEDLVQETYAKVLSRPRFLRREDDLGYLVKALRNTWYSHLREERSRREATDPREQLPEELAARTSKGDPESSFEAGEVLDALAELPRPYREAVAAVDVAGLSYAEAARALGVRQGTIMSRVYRGREQVARAVGAV